MFGIPKLLAAHADTIFTQFMWLEWNLLFCFASWCLSHNRFSKQKGLPSALTVHVNCGVIQCFDAQIPVKVLSCADANTISAKRECSLAQCAGHARNSKQPGRGRNNKVLSQGILLPDAARRQASTANCRCSLPLNEPCAHTLQASVQPVVVWVVDFGVGVERAASPEAVVAIGNHLCHIQRGL